MPGTKYYRTLVAYREGGKTIPADTLVEFPVGTELTDARIATLLSQKVIEEVAFTERPDAPTEPAPGGRRTSARRKAGSE